MSGDGWYYYLRSNSLENSDEPASWWQRLVWKWDDLKAWWRYG